MTPFTPLDRWVLTRVLHGYSLGAGIPDGTSERARNLLLSWTNLKRRDCEAVLKNNSTRQEFEAIITGDPNAPQPRPAADEPPPFQIIAADDLHRLPPLQWLVPGEIAEKGMCVLYGESGVGKSFIALDYALKLAIGGVSVVYAPTEGEGGYRKRVEAWKAFHKAKGAPCLHFLFGGINLNDEKLMSLIVPSLESLRPRLLIIDTLAMGMIGLDENSARDIGVFMGACRSLMRRLESALMLVHHTSKAGVVERGSTAIRGNADTMIRLTNADDLVLMECAKTKDEKPFEPRYLKLLEFGESLIPVPSDRVIRDDSVITVNQMRVIDVLRMEVNADGLSLRDLAEVTGFSIGMAQRVASNLMKKGKLRKGKSGYMLSESTESGESGESSESGESFDRTPARSADSPDSPIQFGELPGMPNRPKPRPANHWKN